MKENFKRVIFFLRFYIFLWSLYDASGGKAENMCKKYGDYVFVEEAAPVLLPKMKKDKASQCGIVDVPLVVGGEKCAPGEFPHMVLLGFGGATAKQTSWRCGGSLVSERYVLTAAHCLVSSDKGEVRWALTGDTNLDGTNDDANVQVFFVVERTAHPNFELPATYYDIALVKLNRDVQFDAYSRPACLNTRKQLKLTTAIATGFGRLGYETKETSRDLMKVNLHIADYKTCNDSFKSKENGKSLPHGIMSSQLCAGEKMGGKDTCQGDSGGPLQIVLEEPYCMYSIVGITSFGKYCGRPYTPAVYTRVSYFIPWIESIVWP